MFVSFLKSKPAILLAQQDAELNLPAMKQMSPANWELIEKALTILKPIFLATKALEGDHACLSEVIPYIKKLNKDINGLPSAKVGTFKAEVVVQMNRYFITKYDIERRKEYGIATLLDPRFKLAGFSKKDNGVLAKEMAISEITAQLTVTEASLGTAIEQSQGDQSCSSWSAVLEDDSAESQEEEAGRYSRVRDQVQRYLREKRIDSSMDSREILKYWCANRETYPELANLARRYLSCPPGSAASERLFSQAKHVL